MAPPCPGDTAKDSTHEVHLRVTPTPGVDSYRRLRTKRQRIGQAMQRRRRLEVRTRCPTGPNSVANARGVLDATLQRISASLPCRAEPDLWFA
jgi:hypothetical protein